MSFIKLYQEYAAEFTDAPAIFHHRLSLLIMSTVLNRRVYLRQGFRNLYPNLWLLILAPSTFYRKTYSISIAKDLIAETEDGLVIPNRFSTEGLSDHLNEHPQAIFMFDEFKDLMAQLNKKYNEDAKGFIMSSYECPNKLSLGLRSKRGKKLPNPDVDMDAGQDKNWILNPFLNIVSASTIEWFRESLSASDIAGGFLPRFFVVKSYPKERSAAWQENNDLEKKEVLINILRRFQTISGEMSITPAARKHFTEWYSNFDQRRRDESGPLAPFYSRLADEYAKKFAMLFAIDRKAGLTIEKEDIDTACGLADNCVNELREILDGTGNSFYEKERRKVEEFLTKNSTSTRVQLYRAVRIRSRILDEIIAELVAGDKISAQKEEAPDSRGAMKTTTIYRWEG